VDETQPGDYAVLTGPALELSIVQIPRDLASQIEISSPPQARERTPIKLAFVVSSIDETLEAARSLGGGVKSVRRGGNFEVMPSRMPLTPKATCINSESRSERRRDSGDGSCRRRCTTRTNSL